MNTCTGCGYPFLLRGTLCTQCEDKTVKILRCPAADCDLQYVKGDKPGGCGRIPCPLRHWTTERTDQGEQIVLPGAERSARQAAASRGERIKPKAQQRDPGGLFAPQEPEQPKLL